ncbi:hypothetical protein SK854_11230 [Lentzea sp. BCCO 10_0061]|uniref:DUF3558 domain-containing protein n=1 Tax=Lentzea sokolovensis TaxID=3095429 RepID=A0ABU4UT63_9PSEU|nr:hypothetical protein [Lentzea sp. BCCO 10_0061]MDX8142691.1 hypothetical protein [Lentzea sp. BCCO 10_0061]
MTQPPPHGWHQQPPPPQQGWQQPPPGWGPPQPPKKSKAPLVVGTLAGVLVLAGVVTGLVLHLNVNKDSGTSKRADKLPSLCGNVSETALAKARTTNPNGLMSRETKLSKGVRTTCSWNQTKGVDGTGHRTTDVSVTNEREEAESAFSRSISMNMANTQGTPLQKPIEGLGDEAVVILVETKSAFTEMSVIVRKGEMIVEVDLSGWDAGLFANTKPDPAELEAAARGVAEEMVAKI